MTLRLRSLAACLLLSSLVAACGDDAPPDVDGGADAAVLDANVDTLMRDAAPLDLADLGECVAGAVCDTGNPCASGRVDCGSGRPVCIATDDVPPGTTCGTTGVCGGAGSCSVCVEDTSCDTGSPCTSGRLDCSGGGVGVCVATEDLPPGTACGAGLACSTTGCLTCVAGEVCVVADSCGAGRTVCMGATPVCAPAGVAPSGSPCRVATGPCDVAERCDGTASTCPANMRAPVGTPCPAGACDASGACTDVDECAIGTPCGAGAASCTNTAGNYTCACNAGYTAPPSGGTCSDVDECMSSLPCGALATACTNTLGSYACTCSAGYTAPASGGLCTDINECATGTACGAAVATCTNTAGNYTCACNAGYTAPATGGTCIDIDECMAGCGTGGLTCTNTVGSFACTCSAGYTAPASGGVCVDINECATGTPCGAGLGTCANTTGSYACTCNAGYAAPATGGTCSDVDECATGTDDCDRDPAAVCTNTTGTFTCACPASFTGTARGASGCLFTDPSLLSLVPSAGALSPAFVGATTMYTLTLPPGTTSVTFTPTLIFPTRATVLVNGSLVASGTPSAAVTVTGFAPTPVTVVVTTEFGATRTYTVVVSRGNAFIKASNTNTDDQFGNSLALSADGSTLAVGAIGESSNATGIGGNQANNSAAGAGAVYVFTRAGFTWSQQAYIKASNTNADDQFGHSLALSANGSTLAVGAIYEDSNATGIGGNQADNSAPQAGAVYVFTRAGFTWSQQAYIKASNTGLGDGFGGSLALSAEGSTLAVGALRESSNATGIGGNQADNSATGAGAVYVFTRVGSTWSQQAYIKASNTNADDYFGSSLALSSDGSTLAVGAYGEDSNATGVGGNQADNSATGAGAVYVFTRASSTWSRQAYIKASNTNANDRFGISLALSADGSTLAVGAPDERSNATGIGGDQTNNSAINAGAVYVFARAAGSWSQQAYIKASNTNAGDLFGISLALSADGSTLAVGAPREASNATGIGGNQADNSASFAGAVYVFTRAAGSWSQQAYIKASNTNTNDRFGFYLALSDDGSTLAVGAYLEASNATGIGGNQADNSAAAAGAVYVY